MAETLEKAVYHPVAFHKNQGSLTATSNGASFETEDGFELMEVSWQELEKLSVNSKNKEKCLLKLALKDSTNHILHFPSHDESHKAFHEMNLRFNNYQEQNNESAHSGGEPKEFISERFEDDEIPPPKSASTVPKPKPTSALPINANRATNVVAPGATKTVTLPIQTTVAPTKSTTPLSIVKDVENPKAVTPLAPVPREEPDEGACCRYVCSEGFLIH